MHEYIFQKAVFTVSLLVPLTKWLVATMRRPTTVMEIIVPSTAKMRMYPTFAQALCLKAIRVLRKFTHQLYGCTSEFMPLFPYQSPARCLIPKNVWCIFFTPIPHLCTQCKQICSYHVLPSLMELQIPDSLIIKSSWLDLPFLFPSRFVSGCVLATFLIISWLTWCRNHIKLAYPDRNQVACEAKSFHRRVHPDSSAPKVDARCRWYLQDTEYFRSCLPSWQYIIWKG